MGNNCIPTSDCTDHKSRRKTSLHLKEKKFGWTITFQVMIIIPLLLEHLLFLDTLFHDAIILTPLASFYFYCYLIKYEVDRWLSEYHSHQEYLQQKKERDERMKQDIFFN
jgi:hypothetical protein